MADVHGEAQWEARKQRRLLFAHTGERWRVQITLERPDGPSPFALWRVETRDRRGRWIDVADNGDFWIEDPWRRHPAEPSLFICGLGIDAVQPEDEPWTIVHVGAVATEVVALSLDGEAVPFDEATGAFVAVARRATGEPAVLRATTATGRDERVVLRVDHH